MAFSLDISKTRGLGNLEAHDIIEFESEFVDLNTFMVMAVERDDSIPAILLQLWQFEGGYNHAFKNVLENDFGINKQVPYFVPTIKKAEVEQILTYRPSESGLSKKEELFYDLWPETTATKQDEEHKIPYEVLLRFEDGHQEELVLPSWTPLQRLPLDRIHAGTMVEVWTAHDITNIMKVLQL